MTRKEAIKELQESHDMMRSYNIDESESRLMIALNMAIQALSQEPTDIVSRGTFEQVMCERDIAIEQLHELGYELGQKIEPCDDAISRQAVINAIENDCMKGGLGSCFACYNDAQAFRGEIEKLPSVSTTKNIVNHGTMNITL